MKKIMTKEQVVSNANRFLKEDYEMDMDADLLTETAKFALDGVIRGDTINDLISDFLVEGELVPDEDIIPKIIETIKNEIWPRLAKELPRII